MVEQLFRFTSKPTLSGVEHIDRSSNCKDKGHLCDTVSYY